MPEFTISLPNPTSENFSTELVGRAAVRWKEINTYFSSSHAKPFLVGRDPLHWWNVTLDAREMVESLHECWQEALAGDPVPGLGSNQGITLSFTPAGESTPEAHLGDLPARFLQQLFLAANCVDPWILDLSGVTGIGRETKSLSNETLQYAWLLRPTEWPPLETIPFAASWEWFHEDLAYHIDIAETPSQIATFAMLRLCMEHRDSYDHVVLVSQALETLLRPQRGSVTRSLADRIEEILGVPLGEEKWFNDFYQTRSRIVHGSAPIIRPGVDYSNPAVRKLEDGLYDQTNRALGVLLSLIQKLISSNRRQF